MLALSSFIHALFTSKFATSVPQDLLASSTFKLINPRNHRVVTDQVSLSLAAHSFPANRLSRLDDEAILALFTKGFFGGPVFAFERFILKIGLSRILPVRYTGFKPRKDEKRIWRASDIPSMKLLPVGSILFGGFKLVDYHLADTTATTLTIPSDTTSMSYTDFGFGSDKAVFGGCQRFCVVRSKGRQNEKEIEREGEEGQEIEIKLAHFRCNPKVDVDSWAEWITWFHYAYAKLLFANGIRSILRSEL